MKPDTPESAGSAPSVTSDRPEPAAAASWAAFLGLPGRAWLALAFLHMVASLLVFNLPAAAWDWQPGLALQQPWRAWTSAWVHWSLLHLGTNLLAAGVVAAFGWAAQVPLAAAVAWALAWPFTQWGWWLRPELLHYGGLSGILHAGVAIVCFWLLLRARAWRRAIGAAVALGLLIKLAQEQPWGPALRHGGEWDIAVAPLAHALGAVAGLCCATIVMAAPAVWARFGPRKPLA